MQKTNTVHVEVHLQNYLQIETRALIDNQEILYLCGQVYHDYITVSTIRLSCRASRDTMETMLNEIKRKCREVGLSVKYLCINHKWYDGAKEHLDLRSLGFHHNKAVEDELGLCDVLIYGDSR